MLVIAWPEVAALVELSVAGEIGLRHHTQDAAVMDDDCAVVDPIGHRDGRADDNDGQQPLRGVSELAQCFKGGAEQRVLEEEVVDRITTHAQFWEDRNRGGLCVCLSDCLDDPGEIGGWIGYPHLGGAGSHAGETVGIGGVEVHGSSLADLRTACLLLYTQAQCEGCDQMSEEPAPYGSGSSSNPAIRKVRTHHLQEMKSRGERFTMLTAYDMYTAQIFDEAGIELLLVGDSASNNVYGNETSIPVTVDEMLPLTRAVARSVKRAMVVGDLPFGSYQRSAEQAYDTATRFMKEGGAHCVKLEGGVEMVPQVEKLTRGGIPVIGHIGFTPQSEHALGGYRVQGRGETAQRILADARALAEAGAFALVMEMVPGDVAGQVTAECGIPTIGIGAGNQCDGQVLVWQDAFGLRGGKMARFVKQYADLRGTLLGAAKDYAQDVRSGNFPGPEHTF